jgi:glycosyltransferase involved in cell wall biosynthesis
VSVIPNCLDTERWKPMEQALARDLLGLPTGVPLLLFGAMGGGRDPRKGFDLLSAALGHLRGEIPGLELVVFGQLAPRHPPDLGFPIHYTGHLHDDLSLRALYSAADAMVVPSRQDNLPNTAVEAQACGTPVVGFNICGLPDIIKHKSTGYLAKAFEIEDLAAGIHWVLGAGPQRGNVYRDGDVILGELKKQSRELAVARFSKSAVAVKYRSIYDQVISSHY